MRVLSSVLVLLGLLMCAARVFLSYSWRIAQAWWAAADDGLMVREAIGQTPADQLTLAKRPGYPMFLRLVHFSHVPLTVVIALCWIAAALCLAWVVWRIGGGRIATFVAFTLALWCPVGFDARIGQVAYRGSIIAPSVLVLAASLTAMFVSRSWLERLLWAVAAGSSSAFIWLAKEDSLWIVPMIAVALVACIIRSLTVERRKVLGVIVVLPALVLPIVGDAVMRLRAERDWGVAMLDTRTEGELAGFASRIYRIKSSNRTYKRWSPDDAIDKALRAAPELESLRPYLMHGMYRETMGDGKGIYGDHIMWQLRSAITQANGNQWPSETDLQRIFAQANKELDAAEERGDFEYDGGFSPSRLAPPLTLDDLTDHVLPNVMPTMLQTLVPREWRPPMVHTRVPPDQYEEARKVRYIAYINEYDHPQRFVPAATWIERGWSAMAVVCALWALVGLAAGLRRLDPSAFIALAFVLYAAMYTFAECWFLEWLPEGIWQYVVANTQPMMVVAIGIGTALTMRHVAPSIGRSVRIRGADAVCG
ncbi:hypothetical protein COO72_12125 [Bifidobacterium callitrichos]|nr:hypothetical protein COO72_12125 [Bifidobacterium callitrichos]